MSSPLTHKGAAVCFSMSHSCQIFPKATVYKYGVEGSQAEAESEPPQGHVLIYTAALAARVAKADSLPCSRPVIGSYTNTQCRVAALDGGGGCIRSCPSSLTGNEDALLNSTAPRDGFGDDTFGPLTRVDCSLIHPCQLCACHALIPPTP